MKSVKKNLVKTLSIGIVLLLIGLMLFPFVNAQSNVTQQSNQNGEENNLKNSTQILLNITNTAIQFAKKYGVNVTQAENYYSIALNLYNEGNYTGAISYLHMAMKNLANQMRTKPSVINVSQLQAEGIKMQLLRIEEFVNTDAVINSTYKDMIISQIKMALNNITQGNVSNAAKILTQIKEELMQISVNISNVAKEKVAKFIKNRFENDANKINKLFQDEFGNASSVYGNAQLTVTPVMELVENQLSKNATNLSIDEYSHLLIALNNLEGIVMTQRLSFVVNQTGRMNFIWPMLIKINVINASLQQASEIVQNNTTLSKAVNLMESSLNLTKYSIKEYTLGFDNVALSLINESIQEDKEAQNILSNTQLMMVNRLIMISNRILVLDYRINYTIENSIIIGKNVTVIGFLVWNLTNNSYLMVGHMIGIQSRGFMPYMDNTWQLIIINITKNTVINGKLSLDSLVKVNGIITGKYYTIYELNATQVNVLSYMFNNFSMSDYNS